MNRHERGIRSSLVKKKYGRVPAARGISFFGNDWRIPGHATAEHSGTRRRRDRLAPGLNAFAGAGAILFPRLMCCPPSLLRSVWDRLVPLVLLSFSAHPAIGQTPPAVAPPCCSISCDASDMPGEENLASASILPRKMDGGTYGARIRSQHFFRDLSMFRNLLIYRYLMKLSNQSCKVQKVAEGHENSLHLSRFVTEFLDLRGATP